MRLPPGIVLVLLVLPARLPSAAAAAAATAAMLHASLPLSSAGKRLNNACIFPPFSHNFSVVFVVVSFSVFCFLFSFSVLCFLFRLRPSHCCCHWQGKQVGHQLVNPPPPLCHLPPRCPVLQAHTCRCRTCYHFESRARPPSVAATSARLAPVINSYSNC